MILGLLQVDLGACCTKGNGAKCVSELAPAYKDLDLAQKPGADVKGLASKAVGLLLKAVRERVKPEQVTDANAKKLMALCPNAPSCPTEELFEEQRWDEEQGEGDDEGDIDDSDNQDEP